MNNVCYDAELEHELLFKYMSLLQHGAKVVAVKDLFPRINPGQNPERWRDHPVSIFDYPWLHGTVYKSHAVSWTSSPINYHIYQVNRHKVFGQRNPSTLTLNTPQFVVNIGEPKNMSYEQMQERRKSHFFSNGSNNADGLLKPPRSEHSSVSPPPGVEKEKEKSKKRGRAKVKKEQQEEEGGVDGSDGLDMYGDIGNEPRGRQKKRRKKSKHRVTVSDDDDGIVADDDPRLYETFPTPTTKKRKGRPPKKGYQELDLTGGNGNEGGETQEEIYDPYGAPRESYDAKPVDNWFEQPEGLPKIPTAIQKKSKGSRELRDLAYGFHKKLEYCEASGPYLTRRSKVTLPPGAAPVCPTPYEVRPQRKKRMTKKEKRID